MLLSLLARKTHLEAHHASTPFCWAFPTVDPHLTGPPPTDRIVAYHPPFVVGGNVFADLDFQLRLERCSCDGSGAVLITTYDAMRSNESVLCVL